jgi:hypothetical protein
VSYSFTNESDVFIGSGSIKLYPISAVKYGIMFSPLKEYKMPAEIGIA